MKNKYYAVVDGKEVLVRTTTKDHYKYAWLGGNNFGATKEDVIKAIKSWAMGGYNRVLKYGYEYYENGKHIVLKGKELEAKIRELKQWGEAKLQQAIKEIVEVYIK